ncbi:MAG: hypothetical protein UW86_C0022G0003 [Microgenomates group bacterium GW2011_GWA1_Microgenomates_45_10]|nr:MAG: hypothetical protein UW69_C0067G0003 [Microgenomates group bacterium GW2011_GWA2_44_7]KKT76908.1 MAG: hypothetical protein UW73_C0033G0003 [Microgenomates group bacterium GW2011_GWB1_44_8]KKT86771.1 MAG: hypothetical protein UW86_C0022G0003 [Microgenomates group bacterium GW2011_GWA1_Microgenomates_45_10]
MDKLLEKKPKSFIGNKYLILGVLVVFGIGILGVVLRQYYSERIFPGVRVGKVSLGGLDFIRSEELLESEVTKLPSFFTLRNTEKKWIITREQIGLKVNVKRSLTYAKLIGRRGDLFTRIKEIGTAVVKGIDMGIVVDWDEGTFQKQIALLAFGVEKLPESPSLLIENETVIINRGRNGELIRRDTLKEDLEKNLRTGINSEILLQTVPAEVELSPSEEAMLRSRAERLIGSKIMLIDPEEEEENTVVLTDKEIVGFLATSAEEEIDNLKLTDYVASLAETLNKSPVNASFQFIPSTGKVSVFRPSREGVTLDRSKVVDQIDRQLRIIIGGGERALTVELPFIKTNPEITTDEVNDLGIKDLLGKGISYYAGSIPGRIHNIILATSRLNGVLVAPGEEFSFNKALGDVSAGTGYQQAYVIKGGRTVLGDGGGVCQVSTTLFRAVLNAGLPIGERWAHAYRVHYYEENSDPGLDATVYAPSVDFKFKNDTTAYILIQTKVDEKKELVTFELYGASDGRRASISKTRVWEVTAPPPPLYQDDPTILVGKVKQVDFAAWGAKTAFDWKVTRNGEILEQKTFYSNYRPWQAIFLKGTKPI